MIIKSLLPQCLQKGNLKQPAINQLPLCSASVSLSCKESNFARTSLDFVCGFLLFFGPSLHSEPITSAQLMETVVSIYDIKCFSILELQIKSIKVFKLNLL